MTLLLPAVQAARESARRAQCQNNLKQIALASHQFHDARRVLPPGRIAKQHPAWLYLILPHLEQQAVMWPGATRHSMYEMPEDLRTFVVSPYLCPSRQRDSPIVTLRADSVPFFTGRQHFAGSVSDYGGIKGARVPGETYTGANVLNENGAIVHGVYDQFPNNAQVVTGWRGRLALSKITDGSSQTLMIGEISRQRAQTSHAFNGDTTGGHWLGVLNPPVQNQGEAGIGSEHVGINVFAFCDGSMRALSKDAEVRVLEALATRNGGEVSESP